MLFFSLVLGLLLVWLLWRVMDQIGDWPGPAYDKLEQAQLAPALLETANRLREEGVDLRRRIEDRRAQQTLLRDSTDNSQRTMNQLLELHRLSLEKGLTPTAEEQQALAEAERLFLANQGEYQHLSAEVARLDAEVRALDEKVRAHEEVLDNARAPVREAYARLLRRHEAKVGAVKLAVLVPLMAVALALFIRKRVGAYALPVYAFGLAILAEVLLVIHEHFHTGYFIYILLLASIAVVVRAIIYLVKVMRSPSAAWRLARYRQAYAMFVCPICGFPIRRGPMKFMIWTRRGLKEPAPPTTLPEARADDPYTCPSCGTRLFEECTACHAVRHALLPACERCGAMHAPGHAESAGT
jgi:predicted RNA-binding Zn-ribbon protein involved in translation (DUF1610 family)